MNYCLYIEVHFINVFTNELSRLCVAHFSRDYHYLICIIKEELQLLYFPFLKMVYNFY